MKVYVAAPFESASMVRSVHERLQALGHVPTSSWAKGAEGKDKLHLLSLEQIDRHLTDNDADIVNCDVFVAFVVPGLGKEMFCEAAKARILGIPIFWVGREEWMPLSSYRPNSRRVEDATELMKVFADLVGDDGLDRARACMRQF